YLATSRSQEAEPHLRAAAADETQASGKLALADYLISTDRAPEATTILNELAKRPEFMRTARLRLAPLLRAQQNYARAHSARRARRAANARGRHAATTRTSGDATGAACRRDGRAVGASESQYGRADHAGVNSYPRSTRAAEGGAKAPPARLPPCGAPRAP